MIGIFDMFDTPKGKEYIKTIEKAIVAEESQESHWRALGLVDFADACHRHRQTILAEHPEACRIAMAGRN